MSMINGPFKSWSAEGEQKKLDDEKVKKKFIRVYGSKRTKLFRRFLDEFRARVLAADDILDGNTIKAIFESIKSKFNKSSVEKMNKTAEGFGKDIKPPLKTYTAELEAGFAKTALIGRKAELRALKKGSSHESIVVAEIMAREFPTELDEFIKK